MPSPATLGKVSFRAREGRGACLRYLNPGRAQQAGHIPSEASSARLMKASAPLRQAACALRMRHIGKSSPFAAKNNMERHHTERTGLRARALRARVPGELAEITGFAVFHEDRAEQMKFLDQAKIYVKAGDGGAGCISFRREKFIEFGGPGRRRWRARRRRRGRMRRWPQHADRLPLPAAFQGEDRRARHGPEPRRRQLARHGLESAGRHADLRGRRRDPDRRFRPRSASARCSARAAMAVSATPISRPRPIRRRAGPIPAWRERNDDLAAPEADRRCRARRPAQCRQVDLSRARVGGQAQDRRLSFHDAASRISASYVSTAANSCWPIFPA